MVESRGKYIIRRLARQWKTRVFLAYFLTALAITSVIVVLLHKLVLLPLIWTVPMLVVVFVILLLTKQQWKVSDADVAIFLNRHYTELQESAQLVCQPIDSLNFLQKIQLQRIEPVLEEIKLPKQFERKPTTGLFILLIAAMVTFILLKLPIHPLQANANATSQALETNSSVPAEKILPEIKSIAVLITPPAYTNKGTREQSRLNLLVEDGAASNWQIKINVAG
jgi:hypothetical protein